MAADDVSSKAGYLLEVGRPQEAAHLLSVHLGSNPTDTDALCLLALTHLQQGDRQTARQAVEAALRADPENEWSHRLAAIIAGRSGRYRLALRHAERAVALSPHGWQARIVLSQALVNRRRARAALEQAREAVRLAPEEAGAQMQLSVAARAARRRNVERAALAEALRLDPTGPEVLGFKAHREVEEGLLGDAAASITSTLAMHPTDERGHVNLEDLVATLLRRLLVVAVSTSIVPAGLLVGELEGDLPGYWPRALAGVLVASAVAIAAWNMLRDIPPHVRRHMATLSLSPGGSRLIPIWTAACVVSFAMLAFLPAGIAAYGLTLLFFCVAATPFVAIYAWTRILWNWWARR